MSRRTEFQVGLTVLGAVAIGILGVAWLKDFTGQRHSRVYRVTFPQAGGLSSSDEVQVNGLRHGEVRSMRLEGDHVVVELALTPDIVITTQSVVAIRNVGLMGERVIAVDLKTTGRPYAEGETITGVYEMGMGEVMAVLGTSIESLAALSGELERVAQMLSQDGKLQNTVQNFNRTSEELRLTVSENRALLRSTLENFAAASKSARSLTTGREAELHRTLDHFSSAAEKLDNLSGRLDSLRTVLQRLSTKVDRGEGTLGKLVQDQRLYDDLSTSVQALKALVEDIKANPKKYLHVSIF